MTARGEQWFNSWIVDHPAGTEVYSDERFSDPPPALKVYTTAPPRAFTKATDDNGKDVNSIVRDIDQQYLDMFGRGQYQGVIRDHWVELIVVISSGAR